MPKDTINKTHTISSKRPFKKRKPIRRLPILSLEEATKRLNDDKVWAKASKGFRDDE